MGSADFKPGDLVWAKMKRHPPWPARVVQPISNTNASKYKKARFVCFFGSNDYAWIHLENIVPHSESVFDTISKKRNKSYQCAIDEFMQELALESMRVTSSPKMKKKSEIKKRIVKKEELVNDDLNGESGSISSIDVDGNSSVSSSQSIEPLIHSSQIKVENKMRTTEVVKILKKCGRPPKMMNMGRAVDSDVDGKSPPGKRAYKKKHVDITEETPPQKKKYKIKTVKKYKKKTVKKYKKKTVKKINGETSAGSSNSEELDVHDDDLDGEVESSEGTIDLTSSNDDDDDDIIEETPPQKKRYKKKTGKKYKKKTGKKYKKKTGKRYKKKTGKKYKKKTVKKINGKTSAVASNSEELELDVPDDFDWEFEFSEDSDDWTSSDNGVSETFKPQNIGFIGLDAFGRVIAAKFLNSNFDVTLLSEEEEANKLVGLGAKLADSPAEMVVNCDITFCFLDSDIFKNILTSENGILKGFEEAENSGLGPKGCVGLNAIDYETSVEISEAISLKNGLYLEAPICGTCEDVIDGTSVVVASGDKKLFRYCKAYFKAISKKKRFVSSEIGYSSKLSIISNALNSAIFASMAEVAVISEKLGIVKPVYDNILVNVEDHLESMIHQNFEPITPMKHMQKNRTFALKLAESVSQNQHLPVTSAANELYKDSRLLNCAESDVSTIYKLAKY